MAKDRQKPHYSEMNSSLPSEHPSTSLLNPQKQDCWYPPPRSATLKMSLSKIELSTTFSPSLNRESDGWWISDVGALISLFSCLIFDKPKYEQHAATAHCSVFPSAFSSFFPRLFLLAMKTIFSWGEVFGIKAIEYPFLSKCCIRTK